MNKIRHTGFCPSFCRTVECVMRHLSFNHMNLGKNSTRSSNTCLNMDEMIFNRHISAWHKTLFREATFWCEVCVSPKTAWRSCRSWFSFGVLSHFLMCYVGSHYVGPWWFLFVICAELSFHVWAFVFVNANVSSHRQRQRNGLTTSLAQAVSGHKATVSKRKPTFFQKQPQKPMLLMWTIGYCFHARNF